MAKTEDGLEFYVVVAKPDDETDPDELELALRRAVRQGDGVFRQGGSLYVALPGDVTGAGAAARRLMALVRKEGIETKIYLVAEPFPEEVQTAASEVILGHVKVKTRQEAPGEVNWEGRAGMREKGQ